MRIGMMADVYKPHVSGITTYISLNKTYLEKKGHEVFVFTFGDEEYADTEKNIIRSPGLPLLDTGYFISLRYSSKARRALQSMDVVHVHHPFLSGSLALRYCRPRGIPIIFTNHTRYDLYAQAYLPVLADVIGETTMAAYMAPFCRNCDQVISPSNGMRQVLQRFGVDVDIDVVPNGVELEPFRERTSPITRENFGLTPKDVVLIYVGRLGPEKNLNFLLRSFAGAAQAYDHIALLLVGDGPQRDDLQDLVNSMHMQERVHFTGMVPYEQLPGYLATADAFVTASVTEVHPLSVIEAMAAGLPVLGIQSPGVGDTIEDSVTGLIVQNEDLAAFTAKMVRLVTQHEQRHEMGSQARVVVEKFAIERTTDMMVDQYKKVIQVTSARKHSLRATLLRMMDGWGR
jgi:1,2-diacylglycerol 3-alpha-glucosyltransferase